ncbi:MAG: N-acetyltransferase [Thermoleophilia bacterium]|nr:N-acetyltransferase [Thermoleophilia bacterium]
MTTTFTEDTAAQRLEILVDGDAVGHIAYEVDASVATIAHTIVEKAYEGRGYAGELVRESLRRFAERDLLVRPTCSFAAAWIKQHPEFHAQVEPGSRALVASNGHGGD